jgi:hypothetical protein
MARPPTPGEEVGKAESRNRELGVIAHGAVARSDRLDFVRCLRQRLAGLLGVGRGRPGSGA